MRKQVSITILISVVCLAFAVSDGRAQQKSDYPSQSVEFVIHAGPGSGGDIIARQITKVIVDHKLVNVSLQPVNKQGASGAIARAYMAQKAGNPYYLYLSQPSSIMVPMIAGEKIDSRELVPVVNLCTEINTFAVRGDSPYKTLKDVIDAAKAKPDTVTVGTSQMGSYDTIIVFSFQKALKTKLKLVSLGTSGAAVTNLLGGHVSSIVSNPAEMIDLLKIGRIRLLCVFTDQRSPEFPDVPTAKELGYNLVFYSFRGVVMAKNVPDRAVQYWEGVFKKACETDQWKKSLKDLSIQPLFMDRKQFSAYYEDQYNTAKENLGEMNLLKK